MGNTQGVRFYSAFSGLAQYWMGLAVLAAVLIVVAFLLVAFVGRRRFNRRNALGVQQFRSYGHSVSTRLGEAMAELVGFGFLAAGLLSGFVAFLGFMAASGK